MDHALAQRLRRLHGEPAALVVAEHGVEGTGEAGADVEHEIERDGGRERTRPMQEQAEPGGGELVHRVEVETRPARARWPR